MFDITENTDFPRHYKGLPILMCLKHWTNLDCNKITVEYF